MDARTELERQIFDYLDQGLPSLLKQKITASDSKSLVEVIADFVQFRVLPGHTAHSPKSQTLSTFEPSEGPAFLDGLKKL